MTVRRLLLLENWNLRIHALSMSVLACVGAHDATKAFQDLSKAVGKQLKSICCNNVMIKAL